MIRSLSALAVAATLLAPVAIHAQVNTATVAGTVTDATGAVVPEAALTLQNPLTGLTRSVQSDTEGRFSFTFVPIGTYTLKCEHTGFQETIARNIALSANMSLEVPITISLQSVQSSVTVKAGGDELQTTTSAQTDTLSESKLNELPVAKQNWVNLLALDPSVASSGANGIVINGLPPTGYNVTVDGTNATSNPEYNSYNVYGAPNIINTVANDAIAEVSLVKGVAPATVGGTMSGNVNIITKGGSNQFHGGAYEINEVSAYDARNQFLTTRPRLTFNQYGGSLGGPILREKLFFFFNYEGAKAYSQKALSGTVPSPYLKSIAPTVFGPLLALYPSIPQPANATALVGTYSGSFSQVQKDGSGLIRIDSNLNASNQIAVRYIRARPQFLIPSIIPVNPQTYSGHTDAVNANYLHVGSNWTSNARFGFNQIKLTRINPGFNLKLNSLAFAGFGSASITGNMYKAFLQHGNYTTYEETIGLVRGKHNFQLGAIAQRQNASRYIVQTPGVTYSSLSDFQANIPSNVILELYSVPGGQPPFGFVNYLFGVYAQDDYRLTDKLTLNIGMRYDYYTVPREYAGRFYNRGVDPAHAELGAGFGPYRPADSIFDADHRGIQPRIGIAWTPNNDTVVHAGFGILTIGRNFFSGPVNLTQPSATLPFSVAVNRAQAQQAGLRYPIDPLAYADQVAGLQSSGVLSSSLPNTTTVPAYNPNPYSLQWTLGVQQSMRGGIAFTMDYVGTTGVQLSTFETKNLPNRLTGVAPLPSFGQFTQNGTGDRSNYHALQTKIIKRMFYGLQLGASYVYSQTLSHSDVDILQPSQPQDPDNFAAEYGPALFDIKHSFKLQGSWQIPFTQWVPKNTFNRTVLDGWLVSAIFSGQTGLPANVRSSASSYPSDRPDPNPNVAVYVPGSRTFPGTHQYLNPLAFTSVPISTASGAQIRGGFLRRNAVRTPGLEVLDLSIAKTFAITEKVKFMLRGDAFNALNHTNLSGLNSNPAASTFGQLTTATPRTMQVMGRISF
jgi:hypothetical protein